MFREGGGTGYVDTPFDDTWVMFSPADDVVHGDDYNGIKAGQTYHALIAVKDMFSYLPATSGTAQIHIVSADLHLWRNSGDDRPNSYPLPRDDRLAVRGCRDE